MLLNIGIFVLLLVLFYALSKIADRIVAIVAKISRAFGVKMYFMGIILAFFTSLPEFSIGVNALISNVPGISLGNFLGSLLVVFGLVFGVSLILNRQIKTDGKLSHFAPVLVYLFLPFLFALDGTITRLEGMLLIFWYGWIVYFLFTQHAKQQSTERLPRPDRTFVRDVLVAGVCIILMIAISSWIIQLTEVILKSFDIKDFVVGLLLFSIGTNLPEIIVMVRAWQNGLKELSMSHLMGSVIFDPLLIGIFAFLKPYTITVDFSFYILFFFAALLLIALGISYVTGKEFSRQEGFVLLAIYFCFVAGQLGLVFLT